MNDNQVQITRIFCLPSEWENFRYRPITKSRLETYMHKSVVVDSAQISNGIVLRLRSDSYEEEALAMITGSGNDISAKIAFVERDRLPDRPYRQPFGTFIVE